MRRKEREITEQAAIESVINDSSVCRIGMSGGPYPYIVPVNFCYEERTLYFHSAPEGKKIDFLRKAPKVCVEFDIPGGVTAAGIPCDYGFSYRSVIAFGQAEEVTGPEEKRRILEMLFSRYGPPERSLPVQMSEKQIEGTAVWRVDLDTMTGKAAD